MTHIQQTFWRIYRNPLAFAITSTVGLVAALVGDGVLDVVGWALLLTPLLAATRYLLAAPPQSHD